MESAATHAMQKCKHLHTRTLYEDCMRKITNHTNYPPVTAEAGTLPQVRGTRATYKRSANKCYGFGSCLRTIHGPSGEKRFAIAKPLALAANNIFEELECK
jgi:hypothetical protein